jgi:Ser/Thr protein kinase RdoA (MazF antagonist)
MFLPISAKGNLHWRVQSGRDAFVLRMYRRSQSIASIQYEFDILAYLSERRWPVAAAISGVVQRAGKRFALFPFLPGGPCREENEQQSRRRGRILAKLHMELDEFNRKFERSTVRTYRHYRAVAPGLAFSAAPLFRP